VRAAWYDRVGPAEDVLTVGEIETPVAVAGEVLVRIAASGINPSDTKKRAGWLGGATEFPRIIPHSDGAGTIEDVGPGVDRARIGERVWLSNAQYERANGTAAAYVTVPEDRAARLPDDTSFAAGACLGVPACTAHYALFWNGPVDGRTVLVQGAAGSVGGYAVQLAVSAGARVLATVSTPEKAEIARRLGAAVIVDYKTEDVVDTIMRATDGAGVDHIVEVDFGANADIDAAILKPRGSIGSYSSTAKPRFTFDYYAFGAKGARIAFCQVYRLKPEERARAVTDLTRLMEAGQIRHAIAATYPLKRIAEAHQALESGAVIGNIVLEV
jgi:NADPH:quinone reductase-like Zn-dependent oxidoreductase